MVNLSAFLASASDSFDHVSQILPNSMANYRYSLFELGLNHDAET